MKLTLFTISNEQIKEQLSKLQTKVESLETVKDVQDKIISAKDSQITFLQGEISTLITCVSIAVAIITALATLAYAYIKSLEKKANKKIEEAESTLRVATEQLAEIAIARQQTETHLTESDLKTEQLNSLIDKSNNIATVAQEKIEELEEKQIINMKFNTIKTSLDLIKERHIDDKGFCHPDYMDEFNIFIRKIPYKDAKYRGLFTDISNKIIKNETITEEDISSIELLEKDTHEFVSDYMILLNKSGVL
ncbi:TPA: hypothetical protein QCO65_005514 [Bacillus cereus]|uniref:hypothetical protein n=1 Tax=Bacillus TaxID=1386 RepID=UPI001C027349|nr:hypothetical protein [Bacillus mycoides]QWG31052.1 hypothetical protein EXW58_26685 [Bacillus mycoides]HDR3890932.1 hypothetical protein [Bacillus cereus]